ncbi:MAG: prepilin-type N-terminal cleavage/methylation domain-containing protein [Woeseiaceae bacterium]|nr:prepilin-type N-terminal cleavage/methylation domain-containing protein [Woeseiaceae bacterium]
MDHTRNSRHGGFSLLELLVVVAIVAMLSAFAYPSYMNYVVNTKRTAATTMLMRIADRQQQFFMDNKRYANALTELGYATAFVWVSDNGNTVPPGDADAVYAFGLANITPTQYLAFAAPIGQQQIRDTKCAALTIDHAGAKKAYGSQPDDCW